MGFTPASSSGAASGGTGVVASGSRSTDVATAGASFAAGANVLAGNISFTANGTSSYAVFLCGPGQTNDFAGGGKQNTIALVLDGAQSTVISYAGPASTSQAMPFAGMSLIATPAAGVHTVNCRLWTNGGTATLFGSGSLNPSNILVYVLQLA